jgi:hypothetical protein
MDVFEQNRNRYQQLRSQLAAGQLSSQQFRAEAAKLRWQDATGAWWAIDADSGGALRYDGARWVPAQPPPPARPAAPPSTPPQPASPPAIVSTPGQPAGRSRNIRALIAATPILALVPSVVCGGLWFLYTFIGVFKSEGIQGVDWVTPLIVIGMPIFFWVLKRPVDQLLMPLKPAITGIARPVRLGISLAVPVVLGCGCSLTAPSGYTSLNVASFISILVASILMRY